MIHMANFLNYSDSSVLESIGKRRCMIVKEDSGFH